MKLFSSKTLRILFGTIAGLLRHCQLHCLRSILKGKALVGSPAVQLLNENHWFKSWLSNLFLSNLSKSNPGVHSPLPQKKKRSWLGFSLLVFFISCYFYVVCDSVFLWYHSGLGPFYGCCLGAGYSLLLHDNSFYVCDTTFDCLHCVFGGLEQFVDCSGVLRMQ